MKGLERTDSAPPHIPLWKRILGVPYTIDLLGDDDKPTFANRFKVLWAKTFLAWDDYSPPTKENPAGKLYGARIPDSTLANSSDWYAKKEDFGDKNPYTFKNGVKAFFGFPYKEENGLNGVRLAGFVIKLIPKILLNTLKLFTEILTGSLVAASETLIDKATDNFNLSTRRSNQVGWYMALTLGRIFLPVSSLLHFTGKAITSPLDNMIDAWKYFADMRAKEEWYWKALGWGLGLLGGLFSVAVTATMYFLLAPVMAAIGTFIAGSIGLSSAVTSIIAASSSFLQLLSPVTTGLATFLGSFLPAVLSPTLTAISGFVVGVVLPLIVAPVLTGIDKAVSWLANKVVNGVKFLINKIKDSKQNEEIPENKQEVENNPQDDNEKKGVLQTTADLNKKMKDLNPKPTGSNNTESSVKEKKQDEKKIAKTNYTTSYTDKHFKKKSKKPSNNKPDQQKDSDISMVL